MHYLKTKQIRKEFKRYLIKNGFHAAYLKKEYRRRIPVHCDSLKKYLSQLPKYLFGELGVRWDVVSVRKVYDYFKRHWRKLIPEFMGYLENKTYLSYEITVAPKPLKIKKRFTRKSYRKYLNERDEKSWIKGKLAEFVVLILAEYVILHNYSWASGLKTKDMRSIDSWLKNI